MGHDEAGAGLASDILRRLRASERLREHVAALTRHHLRLGFLVHQMPLERRVVYDYLRACAPVAPDVTLLSVADRLATRGDNAERAIELHLQLARAAALRGAGVGGRPAAAARCAATSSRGRSGSRPARRSADCSRSWRRPASAASWRRAEEAIERARQLIAQRG